MITYGMGAKSLASKLECSVKEAEDIIEYFYEGFPGVKKLTEESQKMLKEKGYVTDEVARLYNRKYYMFCNPVHEQICSVRQKEKTSFFKKGFS